MSDSVCGSADKAEILTENANKKMKANARIINPLVSILKKIRHNYRRSFKGTVFLNSCNTKSSRCNGPLCKIFINNAQSAHKSTRIPLLEEFKSLFINVGSEFFKWT